MLDHDLQSYITGFLAARDAASAHVVPVPYGMSVTYPPGEERPVEHYVVQSGGALPELAAPAMVHIIDAAQPTPSGFSPISTCRLMVCDLTGQIEPPTGFDAFEVTDLAIMANLDTLPGFLPPSQDLRAVQFAGRSGGHLAAAARSAMGLEQDIIVDNLVVAPDAAPGAAEAVLQLLLATAAARGQNRALASVPAGEEALFQGLGFTPLARIESFLRDAE